MVRRFGRKTALKSLVVPGVFYLTLAFCTGYLFWPYFYYMKNETLIVLGSFAMWRYGWQATHYLRAIFYGLFYYPRLKKRAAALPEELRFPKHLFFIIPSYNEAAWVSREAFHSILSELGNIPSSATLIVATGSDKDDSVISSIYNSHPVKEKVDLIFQRQSKGKRIAMGHALRSAARRYHMTDDDPHSATIFMDGDSYLEPGTLAKVLPFFALMPRLGALTTNEVAFIRTESSWYKNWFNLKFGQRHILFQSHSLSRKVLTLTGRFSVFRSSIVMQEDLIRQIENDVITHWRHGKFRFLMGDDKSSWYYLLKNQWEMLYLPDVLCYSLESRDADFVELSLSLPYRWYGNTLRNNDRALAVGWRKVGLFIWMCILDQRLSMWTSLVGISGAAILSLFKSFIYLPMYLAWVLIVRTGQMAVITYCGHRVSMQTIPLMLYNQWIGAFIKIHSYFNLSSQKWSKGGSKQQKSPDSVGIDHPLARWIPTYTMIVFYVVFFWVLLLAEHVVRMPDLHIFKNEARASVPAQPQHGLDAIIANDGRDDAPAINRAVAAHNGPGPLVITLPEGVLDIKTPVVIHRSNVTLQGAGPERTRLRVSIASPAAAAIAVSGGKGRVIGRLSHTVQAADTTAVVSLERPLAAGQMLLLSQPNTEGFFDRIDSRRWRGPYPAIRQTLVRLNRPSTDKRLYFAREIGSRFEGGKTKVSLIEPVSNVVIKGLTIQQVIDGHDSAEVIGVYENRFANHAVDGIAFRWALFCRVEDVAIRDAGRHPLVFENSLECSARDLSIRGAWNKGPGGNGYLKLSRAYHCRLTDITVGDIRHITLQWSAAYNLLRNIRSGVDINFHGGGEHHNRVEQVVFSIPGYHPWQPVVVTDRNAHWAPPSGPDNAYESRLLNPGDDPSGSGRQS
jgi:glycosyltransferase Alg8